jgi:catechol 2,3-dioxygenase-like lactoylglutathione lyase family enzyme
VIHVSNVSHVLYPVSDMDKSVDFLTNVLGGFLQRRGQTIHIAFGQTLLELVPAPSQAEPHPWYAVGLAVTDLDAAMAELQARVIETVRPIWKTRSVWGRQAVVRDPGGPSIALREWRAPDGPYFTGWYPEPESPEFR